MCACISGTTIVAIVTRQTDRKSLRAPPGGQLPQIGLVWPGSVQLVGLVGMCLALARGWMAAIQPASQQLDMKAEEQTNNN